MRRVALVVASLLAGGTACSTHPDPAASVAESTTATVQRDDDATRAQCVTALVAGVGSVGAELVATYDHSAWMVGASPSLTCALFASPTSGLTFVTPCDLAYMTAAERPSGFVGYRESLRDAGIVIETPPLAGGFFVLTGNAGLHRTEDGMSNFAWDLVRANPDRTTYRAGLDGSRVENYLVYRDAIYLPMGGVLFEVVDGIADNQPCNGRLPDSSCTNQIHVDGNKVGVQVGPSLYLYFLHLEQGTIPFSACGPENPSGLCSQAFLPPGTVLGRVGNSGLSVEPHLHISLLYADTASGRSWGVPVEFHDAWVREEPRGAWSKREFSRPAPDVWVCKPDASGSGCPAP